MNARRLLALCFLFGCSRSISGPTPAVSGARDERDLSTAPAILCNAQGDAADGWLIDALGDNFAPLPTNSLAGAPGLLMPDVRLDGPESYTVPTAYVRFADKARMPLAMRTANSAADAHALAPGDYSLTVTNLSGASGTAAAALRVIPPPAETGVQIQPTGGAPGAGNVCNDQAQTLVIAGSGFRVGAKPVVAFLSATGAAVVTLPSAAVTVVSPTQITATIPSGTFTAAQASASGTQYTVSVTDPAGCAAPYGTAARGFGITDVKVYSSCLALGTLAMTPRFGWSQKNQIVTITNTFSTPTTQGFSGGAPTITISAPLKGGTTAVSLPLRRVAFVNANTITALVPTCSGASSTPFSDTSSVGCPNGIAPGGPYTISITDPSGAIGGLSGTQGFVVVANEPPTIASISPSAGDTSSGAPNLQINSGGLTGTNFAATAKPQIVFQVGANLRACDLPVLSQTTSVIHANAGAGVAQTNCVEFDPTGAQVAATGGFSLGTGLFVIRVQDTADPAYGDFSGLILTQPSKKPSAGVDAGAALAIARADFPLVQATDDIGNQYLYALGGIDGPTASGTALSSIEVAQITEFGVLASFAVLDRTALGYVGGSGTTPAPRHGLGGVAVTVPGDTSYVFAVGGIDSSGHAMSNLERAQVLKAADAPVINSPIGSTLGGGLAAGTYYYKVSALLAASDAKNPGGETLASDIEPVTVGAGGSGASALSWPCLAGAVKYRIYRTASPNQPAGTELLLREQTKAVASCTGSLPNETFTDNGGTTPSGLKPQPAGALGRWVSMAVLGTALPTPRGQAAVKLVGDRIFAAGGCVTTTGTTACNASGGETATVDIATVSAAAVVTGYGSTTMSQARRQASITVANKATAPAEFTGLNVNDQWLMVLFGQAAGSAFTNSSKVEVAEVVAAGSDVATPAFSNAGYGPTGLGLTGGWAEAVADLLLVYGDTSATGTGFDFRVPQGSTTICGGGQCGPPTSTTFSATLTSAGAAVANRFLPGEVLFRAYVYAAGGLTGGGASDTAQSTVERILY